jgi:hypothetical protein
MVLHQSRGTSGLNLSSDFFLQSLKGVSSISQRFNAKISYVDLGSVSSLPSTPTFQVQILTMDGMKVSPFPPHSIYIAALACDRLYTSTRDEKYLKDAGGLYVMLRHFAKRWRNAGMFLFLQKVFLVLDCLGRLRHRVHCDVKLRLLRFLPGNE